jgi:hypothetical protein
MSARTADLRSKKWTRSSCQFVSVQFLSAIAEVKGLKQVEVAQ